MDNEDRDCMRGKEEDKEEEDHLKYKTGIAAVEGGEETWRR